MSSSWQTLHTRHPRSWHENKFVYPVLSRRSQGISIGVNLNGTMSRVESNCFRVNNAGGSASGTGIYSDQGLKSAQINKNVFFDNDSAAITLLDAAGPGSLDDVKVQNNTSSEDGDLISIDGSTNSLIKGNTATGADGAGIFLEQGAGGANSNLQILSNTLKNGDDIGINAADGGLVNSTIKNNTAKGNASLGIVIQANNTGNSITNNDFRGNGPPYDCADLTTDGGTAGTANTWKSDKGNSSYPSGICKKK
jgi:parallel beta-helix repeat protein